MFVLDGRGLYHTDSRTTRLGRHVCLCSYAEVPFFGPLFRSSTKVFDFSFWEKYYFSWVSFLMDFILHRVNWWDGLLNCMWQQIWLLFLYGLFVFSIARVVPTASARALAFCHAIEMPKRKQEYSFSVTALWVIFAPVEENREWKWRDFRIINIFLFSFFFYSMFIFRLVNEVLFLKQVAIWTFFFEKCEKFNNILDCILYNLI